MNKIRKVIILGGTHGNELSGVFLVNKWKKNDTQLKERLTTCPVQFEMANPGKCWLIISFVCGTDRILG